jgi:predicted transposase YbfD/YdcC
VDEKTNEITSMPTLLKRLDLKNAIVTWDALNTQKEIVKTVIDGKGDYVGALKRNHRNFYKDVVHYFDNDTLRKLKEDTASYTKTVEKEHSTIITREYYISMDIKWLYNKEKWVGLKSIGVEHKTIKKNNPEYKIINETRYFICSFKDIKDFSSFLYY